MIILNYHNYFNNLKAFYDETLYYLNFQFCFEAMEESGSEGLEEALKAKKDTFLADVDFTCISDSEWLGKKKPCLTYGLRQIFNDFLFYSH